MALKGHPIFQLPLMAVKPVLSGLAQNAVCSRQHEGVFDASLTCSVSRNPVRRDYLDSADRFDPGVSRRPIFHRWSPRRSEKRRSFRREISSHVIARRDGRNCGYCTHAITFLDSLRMAFHCCGNLHHPAQGRGVVADRLGRAVVRRHRILRQSGRSGDGAVDADPGRAAGRRRSRAWTRQGRVFLQRFRGLPDPAGGSQHRLHRDRPPAASSTA